MLSHRGCPPHLLQLVLCNNSIRDAGAAALAKALPTNGKLGTVRNVARVLLTVCHHFGARCKRRLLMMVGGRTRVGVGGWGGLWQLHLTNNFIGDEGATELAKALLTNRALTEVCDDASGGAPLEGPWHQHGPLRHCG